MRTRRGEHGFTLIEVVVTTAIAVVIAGTLGTFFLAGATPAVAAAASGVSAAFDEARSDALADDAETVVFVPAARGTGYSARIYRRSPGDPNFAPRNGPAYESGVAIGETAAPLGAPGFAFAIDAHGTVTGYAHWVPGGNGAVPSACPPGGAFVLTLTYVRDVKTVAVPCRVTPSGGEPLVLETPPPAYVATPAVPATCPAGATCGLVALTPPSATATCPPGTTADGATPGLCDAAPAGGSPPTCPPGSSGTPPACEVAGIPSPAPAPTVFVAQCTPGAPDAYGFASCIAGNPLGVPGPAITRTGCGTRAPIADPGPSFGVTLDVWRGGAPWAAYGIQFAVVKNKWLDVALVPPQQLCGALFALSITIASIVPEAGNAASTPYADTGNDPAFARDGVDALLNPPLGGGWATNS